MDSELPYEGKQYYAGVAYDGYGRGMVNSKSIWWYNQQTRQVDDYNQPNYATRWYYQDPIYTYYFYIDSNKESGSYPSGGEISNIVEWVQYRAI